MTLAENINQLLPELRRFGCMLIGVQHQADRIIGICLQQIIDDPTIITDDGSTKLGLYRVFLDELDTRQCDVERLVLSDFVGHSIAEKLNRLTLTERKVFLLRNIEEFSLQRTAEVMRVTPARIQDLEREMTTRLSQPCR